ncbi:carbamoyltransferase HypF [Thioalkalivibrio sp. ALE11]|uniref:carbamoyltransferase HypF n=1 Tax=Thioalkalivibrio sp. ALE11 TaxID=1265494 RepID=UPI00037FA04E|nr:carbamoyltransferase HypF [Thioalkalivibrio sp. ALE11]
MNDRARARWRLIVAGRVQGVGFRPFVARQAHRLGLTGAVANTAEGVVIEIEGPQTALKSFRRSLDEDGPPAARVDLITATTIPPLGDADFYVRTHHAAGGGAPALAPDRAPCPACRAEIRDSAARRFRYPFTACADCGPRWSITTGLPWERARTTLAGFALCPACLREFEDPEDRRFHAEAMACPECGPQLTLRTPDGDARSTGDAALRAGVDILREGGILALKGTGGFQLLVDATRPDAVARLRRRKQRPEKPLAVMLPGRAEPASLARIDELEQALLESPEAPIVLVEGRPEAPLAEEVAPGLGRRGLMRPSTPLHLLLLDDFGEPVVCTSGNRSGEPLCVEGDEAVARLGDIADAILDHDRPVARALDDSVFQVAAGEPQCLRLGRGCMPTRVPLPAGEPAVAPAPVTLALGGQLKAAPVLALANEVVVGAHVGDLESDAALQRLNGEARALGELCGVDIERIACDRHPDYASTRLAETRDLPLTRVQHHHAHAVAALAEHGVREPALSLVWDGAGLGDDGTLWGGECLSLDRDGSWRRSGHLRPFRLPGGEAAMREPRRALLGLLHARYHGDRATLEASPARALFTAAEWQPLLACLDRGINAPVTSSAGRLFDAVAALSGLRIAAGYEGQAALRVQEAAEAAGPADNGAKYGDTDAIPLDTDLAPWQGDWAPLVDALLAERAARPVDAPARMATRLHRALAGFAVAAARANNRETVALTGGCFQNRWLLQQCVDALRAAGFRPLWPQRIPPGDGGLATGQAVIARRATSPVRTTDGD